MGSIQRHGEGYRAFVRVDGKKLSKVFTRKALAQDWVAAHEAAKREPKVERAPDETRTLRDVLKTYLEKVTPSKKTWREETNRINAFLRDYPATADVRIDKLSSAHLAEWRDRRLGRVKESSVHRDVTWLRAAIYKARDEWRWPFPEEPFRGFEIPRDAAPREHTWGWREILRMWRNAGYRPGRPPKTNLQQAMLAFHIALRTGMRSGEILQLGTATMNWDTAVATVSHKTEHLTRQKRRVPLTRQAMRVLLPFKGRERIFSIDDDDRDVSFRKVRDRVTGLSHLDFHDTRATFLTLHSKKMPVEVLARFSGHKDIRLLVERYYRVTPEELARRYG